MYNKFLSALFGEKTDDAYIMIWVYDGDKIKESFWFKDATAATAFIAKEKRRINVYVGVGLSPQDYGANRRCLKKDIAGITGLWLDIDLQSAEHRKTNLPANITEAYKLFKDIPSGALPSIVINSGHGLQAWWLFREIWTFDSATERADAEQLAKRFIYYFKNSAARYGWDVDSVFNLDRVLRVPGTTNYKGTPVPVELLEINDTRYNPSDFESWLPELSKDRDPATAAQRFDITLSAELNPPFDKFNYLCQIEPRFKQSWDKQRTDLQDQSASSYDMSLAGHAYKAGWSDQEVASLIVAFRRRHSEDLKLRMDYYQRTLACARRGVEKYQAQESIEVYVGSQDPDEPAQTDANTKESLMQLLSQTFDVKIIQILKFTSDEPTYKLKTARGDITLGSVDYLIGQAKLRSKIAAATGKYIQKFGSDKWDNIAQVLLDCCYEVELGDDATEAGEMRGWLAQYLDTKTPYTENEKTEAVVQQAPVMVGSKIAIFGNDFRKWLRVTQQEKMTAKRMGLLMRAINCEPDKLMLDFKGKRTSRSVWMIGDKVAI